MPVAELTTDLVLRETLGQPEKTLLHLPRLL
jgi:hypothetical protein